ncbi:MAG: YfhO family protein [Anaerolineaceae bacterium]|nr:YfhO family protein [Anaerolineaceae bacterium]
MNKRQAYFIVFIIPIVLFLREIILGKSIFWGLPILQFYPWREIAFDQIMNGYLPLWNSYNGFGTPLFANYQSALAYPATWIIFIFYIVGELQGLVWGHLLVNLLHIMFSAIGILKICEDRGISFTGATISALSFSLSTYILARFGFFSMIWTVAWFSWVFLYTSRLSRSGIVSKNVIKLSVTISLMLLAGHAQLSWYILLFCFLYLLFNFRKPVKGWLTMISQFVISNLMAIALSAIQLLPTAALLMHSQRSSAVSSSTAMTYSFWPWHFLNLLNPNLFGHPSVGDYWGYGAFWEDAIYMGLLPALLAIASIILYFRNIEQYKLSKIEIIFFWTISFCAIIFALGDNITVFPWLYTYIPTFDMFNAPARYMVWFVFSFSILAGSTFDQWRKPEKKVLYWVRLGTAGGFAIGIGAFLMLLSKTPVKPTFIEASFQISLLITLVGILYLLNPISENVPANTKAVKVWGYGVVFLVIVDLLFINFGKTPVRPVFEIDSFRSEHNSSERRVYMLESDAYIFRYDTLLNFDDYSNSLTAEELSRSLLSNVNIFQRVISLNNFEPMRIATFDEFIEEINQLPTEHKKKILANHSVNQLLIYNENNSKEVDILSIDALEPIQIYSTYNTASSIGNYLENSKQMPCVYLLNAEYKSLDASIQNCEKIDATLSNLIWQGNTISFTIDTPANGWILINDNYDTGWKAKIDNKNVKVLLSNGFVKAVHISEGKHEVKLFYLPDSFVFGAIISLVSLILVSILTYRQFRNSNVEE